ncbi:disintegrin and metalloproteinase domain-containing protein 9-like [Protopterus annectens]|uniref:disintegrin and metalloproteinase domain-containing protein 9-like n=1 Tax=Protopterus annectens TaxID=7888 RepID=UPI001CF98113|nr:disintegrin and metalloproteinase domain-containing protein 9-like [Protopterus annectens]
MKMIMLLLLGFSYADIHGLSELKAYDIIIPKKVAGPDKQETGTDFPEDQISYILSIDGKDHLVHLQKNVDVISDNCTVFIPSEDEGLTAKKLDTRVSFLYNILVFT